MAFKAIITPFRTPADTALQRWLRRLSLFFLIILIGSIEVTAVLMVKARNDFAQSLLHRSLRNVERGLHDLLAPVEANMEVIQKWGEKGMLDPHNPQDLLIRCSPVLSNFPEVQSMVLASEGGAYFRLMHEGAGWRVSYSPADSLELISMYWDADLKPDSLTITTADRVALKKPSAAGSEGIDWYKQPQNAGDTLQYSGATQWQQADDAWTMNVEITLGTPDRLFEELPFFQDGVLFFITSSGTWSYQFGSVFSDSVAASDLDPGSIVASKLRELVASTIEVEQTGNFRVGSRLWWGGVRNLAGGRHSYWIGLAAAESDVLSAMRRDRMMMLSNGGIVALFSLIIAVVLLLVYNRSLYTQASRRHEPNEVTDLIARGESDQVEFKSTLRWNLRANKPGQEIEIAVMKTIVAYLNTSGGTLLVGVDDDGSVLGIQKDRLANDDRFMLHFNNMIKQYIGLEYSKYIHYYLAPVDEKKVLVVRCEATSNPAFLKHEENEDFYIRVGPSSRKLSTKRTLRYLEDRNR
jgi:hypothetical protein